MLKLKLIMQDLSNIQLDNKKSRRWSGLLSVKHQKKNFFVGRPTCTVCRKEVSYALQGGENVEGHIKSSTRPKFSSALKQQQKSNFFLFLVDTVTKAYVKLNNLMVQQNIGYRLLLLRTSLALQ